MHRDGFFYLYFGNGGSGIGVARAGSPTGPFTDPRGSLLVSWSTPGASGENMWLFDPYRDWVEAETMADQSGIETEVCSEGGMMVTELADSDWILVWGVDFELGAVGFAARVASSAEGSIEIRLDSENGVLVRTCPVPSTGSLDTWVTRTCSVNGRQAWGIHDVYFKFTTGVEGDFLNFNNWLFQSGELAGPEDLIAVAESSGQVLLSWSGSTGVLEYRIKRSTLPDTGFSQIAFVDGTQTKYIDSGLITGTTYYYRVSAVGASGEELTTTEVGATPGQTYTQWSTLSMPGHSSPSIIGFEADLDGDGYSNLIEYSMNTDPGSLNTNLISILPDALKGYFVFTFRQSRNTSGLTWEIQKSVDPANWENAGAVVVPEMIADTYRILFAFIPMPGGEEPEFLYVRLMISSD